MQEQTLDGHAGRPVAIDLCLPCQSFWFDAHESVRLSPGGTLALFRLIGEHSGARSFSNADLAFPNERRVDWSPGDLVDAGIQAVAGWLKRNA
jgi:hypothetical protein